MKRANSLLLCAALVGGMFPFSLLGCGGCANQNGAAAPASRETDAIQRPPADTLSAEAQDTFAYLVFMQAMSKDNEEELIENVGLLKSSRVPASVWLDGAVWLLSRKSGHVLPFLEDALQAHPGDLSLTMLYAETLADRNMTDKALAVMQTYIAAHPDEIDAPVELALLLVKAGRFDEADARLNALPEKARTPLVDYSHARALSGMGRKEEAIVRLKRAVKEMPNFVEALGELAFLHEQRGEWKEARAIYERLMELDVSPQEVTERLINLSLQLNQPDMALRYLKKGPDTLAVKLTAARLFMEARHYLQAETLLQQVAESEDAPPEVFLLLADLAYQQRRDVSQALGWLNRVPADGDAAPRGALLRVQIIAETGRNEDALRLVQEGRNHYADMPEFYSLEARILVRLERKKEALNIIRDGLRTWPADEDLSFLLGSLLDDMGDKEGALKAMEVLLANHPNNAQALNYVGYSLAESERELDRAITLLRKADSLAPNQSYIIDSLAWALYKAGQLPEALEQIRRAVRTGDVIDPAIWEHYGDIALSMNLKDEARNAYLKALEHKPANADALRQRLSTL